MGSRHRAKEGKTIVRFYIVEDDSLIREGLTYGVPWEQLGAIAVGCAENGSAALEEILARQVDVVISDIIMPRMNGIELAQALRAASWKGEILIISAYQEIQYIRGALQAQAVDFLLKPIETEELISVLQRTIRKVEAAQNPVLPFEEWKTKIRNAGVGFSANAFMSVLREAVSYVWKKTPEETERRNWLEALFSCVYDFIPLPEFSQLSSEIGVVSGHELQNRAEQSLQKIGNVLHSMRREWEFVDAVRSQLERHLQHVDANYLMTCLGLSKATFYRLSARCFPEGMAKYIMQYRIEEACHLLKNTDYRITQIANDVGYTDANYFGKVFQQLMGISPSAYRHQYERSEGTQQ